MGTRWPGWPRRPRGPRALRGTRVLAVLAATALIGVTAVGPAEVAQAASYVPISGSGSSWAGPAIDQWASDMEPQGLTINFNPVGSALGRQQFQFDQNDFAASDIAFLTTPDPFQGGIENVHEAYSYIPDVAGGTAFLYNLQIGGRKITNLRLSQTTLMKIFTGQITNWDNPEITSDYGAPLPNLPITVVTRSDGSGASYFLSNWMNTVFSSQWRSFCVNSGGSASNCGPTEFYPGQHPGFKPLNGSDLVANYIASAANDGAIGYDEYAYALSYGIPTVAVLNPAGYYVQPSASNVAIALEKAQIDENPADLTFLMQQLGAVYTDTDPRSYPLSSYSYLIVPRTSRVIDGVTVGPPADFSTAKGVTLSTYINFVLCGAQQTAGQLGYSPLPEPMVTGGVLQDTKIPGAVPAVSLGNYSHCNNPAFFDGQDLIIKDAAYPSPCQYKTAPLDCKVVDGKAVAAGASGAGTGAGSSAGKGGTGPGSVNPNTGQLESGSGPATGNAVAAPVGLAGRPAVAWLFVVLTALMILCAIAVPTALGSYLQRRTSQKG